MPQEASSDEQGLISVTVQDYAWAAEQNVFTLSIAARVNNEAAYELYSLYALDTDGCCGNELDPNDPDIRTEHWLWTESGFGLPEDVMEDPSKQLLLVDFSGWGARIGDSDVEIRATSMNDFIGEDGASIWVMEFDLNLLDAQAVANLYSGISEERLDHMVENAEIANEAVADNTEADGSLVLSMEYRVYLFENGEYDFYEYSLGTVTFTVKPN